MTDQAFVIKALIAMCVICVVGVVGVVVITLGGSAWYEPSSCCC